MERVQDAMVFQQLICGLADEQIQKKLLTKPEMTLKEAEKLIIAEKVENGVRRIVNRTKRWLRVCQTEMTGKVERKGSVGEGPVDLDQDHVPGHKVVQMRKIRTRTIWIRLKQIFELKFWIWLKKVLALELKRNVAGFG